MKQISLKKFRNLSLFLLIGAAIMFTSCSSNKDDYYVDEIIRLEQKLLEAQYERDVYKLELEKIRPKVVEETQADTSQTISKESLKLFTTLQAL